MNEIKNQSLSKSSIFFMWCSLVLAYFLNFFHTLSMGVLQPYLIEIFESNLITMTNIGAMYFYCYLIMQIPTGLLVDKLGVRVIATSGSALTAIGTFIFASADTLLPLYIGRGLVGIGTAVIFICIIKFQLAWMPQKIIMTLTGIACFIGAMGGILAQTPLVYLIENFGWRESLYFIGVASAINALLTLFIKDKYVEVDDLHKVSVFKGLFSVLKNIHIWPSFIYYAAFYGSYVVVMGYSGTSWLENVHNFEKSVASTYISIGVIGSAFAAIVIGYWADKINSRKKPLLISGLIYLIVWVIFVWFGHVLSPLFVGILLFCIGFFSCAYIVCWVCVQKINLPQYSGIAVSIYNMGGFIGPIILPCIFVLTQEAHSDPVSLEAFQTAFRNIFFFILGGYFFGFLIKDKN